MCTGDALNQICVYDIKYQYWPLTKETLKKLFYNEYNLESSFLCCVWLRNRKWNKETLELLPVFLQVFKDNTKTKFKKKRKKNWGCWVTLIHRANKIPTYPFALRTQGGDGSTSGERGPDRGAVEHQDTMQSRFSITQPLRTSQRSMPHWICSISAFPHPARAPDE